MSNLNDSSNKSKSPRVINTEVSSIEGFPDLTTTSPSPTIPALQTEPPTKAKRWSFIQNDLEKALDTWQELEQSQVKLSPEEEQFEKIKTIISQLKSKLEQF